jgi:predicted acylesterase/phospholipase RssA
MRREVVDLVIAGGASHGVGLAGALSVIDLRHDVARVGGASVGALLAAALARGLSAGEIRDMLARFLSGGRLLDRQLNPLNGWGLHKGEALKAALEVVFGDARMCDCVIPLRVVTCDLFTRSPVIIDSQRAEHAMLRIVDVLYASSAIPLWFKVASIPGIFGLFVDGGVVANAKHDLWDDEPSRRTIMLRLANDADTAVRPVRGLKDYAAAIVELLLHASNNAHVSTKAWADVVQIPARPGSGLDFALSPEVLSERYRLGQEAAKRWCDGR